MSSYTVIGSRVEPDCDEWEATVVVELERDTDGVSGEIWVVAGVPEYLRGTAQAARTTRGLETAWLYGDSPSHWCPDQFMRDDYDALLAAATPAALAAWREHRELLPR